MEHPITNVAGNISNYYTNSSNSTDNEEHGRKPADLIFRKVCIGIYIMIFILGTTGNGLVIYFATFRMKKTVNVVWFLNLAIADFIFTFLLILRISADIKKLSQSYQWEYGRGMCKLVNGFVYMNMFTSLFLITVISIDRLVFVKFPVWCQNHRTTRLASIITLIVWILALICSLPYTIYKDTVTKQHVVKCKYNYSKDVNVAMNITTFIFGFVLPLAVIISCYTVILLHIRRNYTTMSKKPLKMISAIIIVFFLCWFPYHLFSLLRMLIKYEGESHLMDVFRIGMKISFIVAYLNSCINPLLYVFMGQDFKEKCWSSIQPIFERAFMEESLRTSFRSKTNPLGTSKSSQSETTFTKVDMSQRVG